MERPAIDDDDGVFTIAVTARLTGMHPQTLRKYERGGLLTPARHTGNQRLYSAAEVRRLRRIHDLVDRGLNLAGLELALAMTDCLDAVGAGATRAELRTAIDRATGMSHGSARDKPAVVNTNEQRLPEDAGVRESRSAGGRCGPRLGGQVE